MDSQQVSQIDIKGSDTRPANQIMNRDSQLATFSDSQPRSPARGYFQPGDLRSQDARLKCGETSTSPVGLACDRVASATGEEPSYLLALIVGQRGHLRGLRRAPRVVTALLSQMDRT
jgi:tetrahydromethanopterin S-methyltransferase subunit F